MKTLLARTAMFWRRLDLPGHDMAECVQTRMGWRLSGTALLSAPAGPCHLEYRVDCTTDWQTRRATVKGEIGDLPVQLVLMRSPWDRWYVNGEHVPSLDRCEDVDLAFTPSTNLLAIRRLRLPIGAHATSTAAWVSFPGLEVRSLEQVYARIDATSYRYRAGAFRRVLTVNDAGFVVDYPGQWVAESQG